MSSHSLPTARVVTPVLTGLAGAALAMLLVSHRGADIRRALQRVIRSQKTATEYIDQADQIDRISHEQEAMRMRRDERRQTPVLTNWEQEL